MQIVSLVVKVVKTQPPSAKVQSDTGIIFSPGPTICEKNGKSRSRDVE